MSTQVKICGLSSPETMDAALAAGADYVGLVFFAPSPRHVELATAQALAERARGRARIVALMVDPNDELVREVVAAVSPDLVQLHGSETPERVAMIRTAIGRPVIKAIKVETEADAEQALLYEGKADLILFDAKAPKDAVLPGGNGAAFDWALLDAVKGRVAFMLSGGLTPHNVQEAIRATAPVAVDVSSGVERHPGEKDGSLIRRFLRAAKTANEAGET
jgi:phosphoribosylanthranilate isomerase